MGAGIPQSLPAFVAQQRAREAAVRRQNASTTPGTRGPVRLGGGNLASLGLTPRELAVLVRPWHIRFSHGVGHLTLSAQAADMRATDEKRCASGTIAHQEAEKAARDSHHSNAIELTSDSDFSDFDFSDNLIILYDAPLGRKVLILHNQLVPSRLCNPTSPRALSRERVSLVRPVSIMMS